MTKYRVAAVAASALSVAACAGGPGAMSGFQSTPAQPQTVAVELLSEPPGAEARAASGESCQTPCTLQLPPTDATIVFSRPGFEPETMAVKLVQPEAQGMFSAAPPPRFEPGSIRAQLRPAPRARRAAPRPAASQPVSAPSRPAASPPATRSAPKPEPKPAPEAKKPASLPGAPWPPVPGSE